jgi:hypothetical protein
VAILGGCRLRPVEAVQSWLAAAEWKCPSAFATSSIKRHPGKKVARDTPPQD